MNEQETILLAERAASIIQTSEQEGHEFHGNQWTGGFGRKALKVTKQIFRRTSGFSLNPATARAPRTGYMVAPSKTTEFIVTQEKLTPAVIQKYLDHYRDALENHPGEVYIGGWKRDDGKFVMDMSIRTTSEESALKLAREGDQDAYFDLEKQNAITTREKWHGLDDAARRKLAALSIKSYPELSKRGFVEREWERFKKTKATDPAIAELALRASALISENIIRASDKQPPADHEKARDTAQTIYEAAAIAAAIQVQQQRDKRKRDEIIAAILLLLLLAGEQAYKKVYAILGTEGLKAHDDIQIHEQARTFAADRQKNLKDYSGRLTDALLAAREAARKEAMGETETARTLHQIAENQSGVMSSTEAQVTYGSVQIDRLKRAGFKTKIWQTMEDERVRPSHVDCGEQGAIDLDKPFVNGLQFPGDPNGGPEEVCNCRCWLIGASR